MNTVFQFKVTLQEIEPTVWRRIQIPDDYTFWDLHVAIQDAMGWSDCHLHQFKIIDPSTHQEQWLGIPDNDGFEEDRTLAGWEHPVADYLAMNHQLSYLYDFGDSWWHLLEYEGSYEKQVDKKYPICLEGQRSCPPEDVGGVPGYYHFLEAIHDLNHEEHDSLLEWVGGKYNPEVFDPKSVIFDDPKSRWNIAFAEV